MNLSEAFWLGILVGCFIGIGFCWLINFICPLTPKKEINNAG